MTSEMRRNWHLIKLTMAVDSATQYKTTEAVKVTGYASGRVFMPSATWTAAAVAVLDCPTESGTFVPSKYFDSSGTEQFVQVGNSTNKPTAGNSYSLPAEFFTSGPYIKLQSQNGAGTAVDQTAARELWLFLKS